MSIRQYVGARYVPRFSDVNNGIWSNVYSYEPLTIVKNGNDYYTSKQSVPVGIAITDTEYWIKTGDYNGAITEINNRIDDLEDEIQQIDKGDYSNAYVVTIGDSYNRVIEGDGWDFNLFKMMGFNTSSGQYNGPQYCSIAQGGSGLTAGTVFNTLLMNAINASRIPDLTKVSHVIIGGGANDANAESSQEAINNALATLVTTIKTYMPNAKIYIAFIGWSGLNSDYTKYRNMRIRYKNAAESIGIRYLHNVEYVLTNADFLVDNTATNPIDYIHPNANGLKEIAKKMFDCLLTGTCNVFYEEQITVSKNTEKITSGNITILVKVHNDIKIISIGNDNTIALANITMGSGFTAGTYTSKLLHNSFLFNTQASTAAEGSFVIAIGSAGTGSGEMTLTFAYTGASAASIPYCRMYRSDFIINN